MRSRLWLAIAISTVSMMACAQTPAPGATPAPKNDSGTKEAVPRETDQNKTPEKKNDPQDTGAKPDMKKGGDHQNDASPPGEDKNRDQHPERKQAKASEAPDSADKDHGDAKSTLTPEKLLQKLHHVNLEEIHMGQMALQKSTNEEVKRYAQTLVDDHTKADEKVKEAAKAQNVELRDMPQHAADKPEGDAAAKPDTKEADPKRAEKDAAMKKIQAATGAEFDREFAQMMLKGHTKALAMVERAKSDPGCAALKGLCDELRPELQKHKEAAAKLVDSTVGPNDGPETKPEAQGKPATPPAGTSEKSGISGASGQK